MAARPASHKTRAKRDNILIDGELVTSPIGLDLGSNGVKNSILGHDGPTRYPRIKESDICNARV